MSSPFVILLDDLTIGRAQRVVLERALAPLLASGGRLRRLTEHPVPVPTEWQVERDPAQRVAALLTMLAGRIAHGPVLWLSSNLVFETAPASPFSPGEPALRGDPAARLARQLVLAFDPAGTGADAVTARAAALLTEDYHQGADWTPEGVALLPEAWRVAPFHAAGRGPLYSCVRFETRPWFNANAPGAGIWRGQLAEARGEGLIGLDDIERDIGERLARPSLAFDAAAGFPAEQHISPTLLQVDAATPPNAASATPEQIRMIELLRFALPSRKGAPAAPRVIEAAALVGLARLNEEKQKRKEQRLKERAASGAAPKPAKTGAVRVNGHAGPHPVFSKAFFARRDISSYGDLRRWAVGVAARKTAPARSAAAASWRNVSAKMHQPSGLLKGEAFSRRGIRSFADLFQWSKAAARYAATHPGAVFQRAKGFVSRRLGGGRE